MRHYHVCVLGVFVLAAVGCSTNGPASLYTLTGDELTFMVSYLNEPPVPPNIGASANDSIDNIDYAISQGFLTSIRILFESGADITRPGLFGFPPLLAAASNGQVQIVEYLLARGAPMESTAAESGFTALHLAAANGHSEVVDLLLEKGADVNATSRRGLPIRLALLNGKVAIANRLLRYRSQSDEVVMAVLFDDVQRLQLAIENTLKDQDSGKVDHPIHFAAACGRLSLVKYMLDHGVDPELPNYIGERATELAIQNRHFETAKLLLDRLSTIPYAVLIAACESGSEILVQECIRRGVEIDEADWGAIGCAAVRGGDPSLLSVLRERGVNFASIDLWTGLGPLHLSVQKRDLNMTRKLLDCGANVNTLASTGVGPDFIDHDKWTPLHFAVQVGALDISRLLIARGAHVNCLASIGTPLHIAATRDEVKIAELLVNAGCDLNMMNGFDLTALQVALHYRSRGVCRLLVERLPSSTPPRNAASR